MGWKTKSLGITAKVHVTINNGRYEELSINEKKNVKQMLKSGTVSK